MIPPESSPLIETPGQALASLLERVVGSSDDVCSLVSMLLRETRLALDAQSCYYFRRADEADSILPAAISSRDDADTLEVAREHHPASAGDEGAYRALWERLRATRAPLVLSLTDDPIGLLPPASTAWHTRFGVRWLACCPLFAGDRPIGLLGIRADDPEGFSPESLRAVQALADRLAVAIVVESLGKRVAEAAAMGEREAAARARVAMLEGFERSLQAVIDAAASAEGLDDLIPAVMRILADAVSCDHCAYFPWDHQTQRVRLQHWLHGDRFLSRAEFYELLPQDLHAVPDRLYDGFTVPEDYLGVAPELHRRSVILDHSVGTAEPDFDRFAREIQATLELNIPLHALGSLIAALALYRGGASPRPFEADEVALAEAVARQLALAVQTRSLADAAKQRSVEAATARQKESFATARAAELTRVNSVLSESARRLSESDDPARFIDQIVEQLGTVLDADSVQLFEHRHEDDELILSRSWRPGRLVTGPRPDLTPPWGEHSARAASEAWQRACRARRLLPPGRRAVLRSTDESWPATAEAMAAVGASDAGLMALFVGDEPVGALGYLLRGGRSLAEADVGLVEACGRQIAVALRLVRQAESARREAVSVERERLSRERLGELVAANRVLVNTLGSLTADPSPDHFVSRVLEQLSNALDAPLVELWRAFDLSGVVFPGHVYHAGQTLSGAEVGHPAQQSGFRIPTRYHLSDAVTNRRHIIWEDISTHPDVPDPMRRWYQARYGVAKMINLPLVVGRQVIGAAVAFAPVGHTHSASQLELAHALASQLALALQLGELNNRARAVAVLEAEERAAQQRARETELLNEVLTRGAERVAEAKNLDDVVIGFLREAKAATGAFCAAAFRLVDGTSHTPLAVVIGDRPLSPEEIRESPVFQRFEERSEADEAGLFARLAAGETVFLRVDQCEPCLYPEALDYHESVGNVMVWHLPLLLGETSQGYVALGMAREGGPTEAESRKLHAIRQHMSLAFELHRLAERERQAAVVAERARLARDIHDTLAQGFLGIHLQLESARRTLETDPQRAREAIDRSQRLAQESLNEARRSVSVLRSVSGDMPDLCVELARLAREANHSPDLPVRFETRVAACVVSRPLAEQVVKIVVEALHNARRHARATEAVVSLARRDDSVRVTVRDNGVGFRPDDGAPAEAFGLVGMRERAAAAGCLLTIDSAPGAGTTVSVVWPGDN